MNLQRALKRDGLFFIITYIYWILAHKDVNTVFTRARACKQEDSGNRIKRAGRRPFEKDDNIWWRYRDDLLFLVCSLL